MFTIEKLTASEILDSRGRPTVQATCRLARGFEGTASVPSGASTGAAEALELRDHDPKRYRGLGCRRASANINERLHHALSGRSWSGQAQLDQTLLEVDGTPDKSNLGANAILAVSLAFARAVARRRGLPLYRHFAEMLSGPSSRDHVDEQQAFASSVSPAKKESESASACWQGKALPRPMINLFSGGKHAGGQAPIQDVLLVPVSAKTMDEALSMAYEIYQCAAELVLKKYGMRLLRADEGGLAPPFPNAESMLEDAEAAMCAAGCKPGGEVALAVDVASSHFFRNGRYEIGAASLDSLAMIEQLDRWVSQYSVVSIEDGLAEEDWLHWPVLTERLGHQVIVVGDDFLCTNPERIRRAIAARSANALLLKVNQIGTVTEALAANEMARAAGWAVTISARSGETEDNWLADLAVGWAGDQIKVGSITQSERLSKYNRLLAIQAETGWPCVAWPRAGV